MAIVATVTYATDAKVRNNRAYLGAFAFQWQPDMTLLTTGNPWIWRENVYGGYITHLKFKPEFWSWSSNGYSLDWIIQDFWVEPPGGGAPIPGQPATFGIGASPGGIFGIGISWGGSASYEQHALPPAPSDYWLQLPYPY